MDESRKSIDNRNDNGNINRWNQEKVNPQLSTTAFQAIYSPASKRKRDSQTSLTNNESSEIQTTQTAVVDHKRSSKSAKSDYPPVSVLFKNEQKESDPKLLEELITYWKSTHKKDLNITGRFGFNKNLLVFANDTASFEDVTDKNTWPPTLNNIEFEIKLPRVLPDTYSLVIQKFYRNWEVNDGEQLHDLQQRYPSLKSLTRLFVKNDTPLNLVRADFSSTKDVQNILDEGTIVIRQMKHPVKEYHQPIRIYKCMKCFSHDHRTYDCKKAQVCIRCAQQHPMDGECKNQIRCANCQGPHFAGHPSCHIVQQKRKLLGEQNQRRRAELLVQKSQQQYCYSSADYVPLPTPASQNRPNMQQQPTRNQAQNIEHILSSCTAKIEQRLNQLETHLTTHLCKLEVKMDNYIEKVNKIEHVVFDIMLPMIRIMKQVVSEKSQHKPTKEQLTNFDNQLQELLNSDGSQTTTHPNGNKSNIQRQLYYSQNEEQH